MIICSIGDFAMSLGLGNSKAPNHSISTDLVRKEGHVSRDKSRSRRYTSKPHNSIK